MMNFNPLRCAAAALLLFVFSELQAQAPIIQSQIGFPVGQVAGRQVAYGNGKYLLLGASNTVFSSEDGSSWSQVSTSGLTATQLNHLAFGAGVFVVVGQGGVIQSSADGINWTSRTSGTANQLYKVSFINNTFFVTGANRTLLRSSDGIIWSAVSFNAGVATDMLMNISYGNGVYVIAARNSGASGCLVYRSTTAMDNSWSYYVDAPAWGSINRIQFLKDRFFAFLSSHQMYSSTDGISWTHFSASTTLTQPDGSSIPWGAGHQIFNGIWDGSKFHFYGSSQYYSGYGSTFTSTDGVNLTLLQKTAYIVPQESAFINGIYFVAGNEGIVSSTDGLVYRHTGASFYSLARSANKYVAVGMISQDGQIFNSTDFSNWTDRTPAGVKELYSVVYDGTRLIAAGNRYVLRSTNEGDSWTTVYTDANQTFTAMAYGNGKLVAGGFHNTTGAYLSYSTDGGATWNLASSNDYYYLHIKYINNRFFAFATDNSDWLGRVMTSTDGINWTDATPDLGIEVLYYKDVAWDGNKYHMMGIESSGYTPVEFFTVSTTTPENTGSWGNRAEIANVPVGVTLGGSWDQGVLNYSNGRFTGAVIDVATGQDYIIYSTDGNSWTAVAQNSMSTISSAYVSGSTVRMVSRANAFFTVNHSGVLPVALLKFEGRWEQGQVKLKWSTTAEQNSKRFVVQHSGDGQQWEQVGMVPAAGNSSTRQDYQLVHARPLKGKNYYRLLQEDIDGKTAYSKTITVTATGNTIEWYPNPVEDLLTIRTGDTAPGQVVVYNCSGQAVKRMAIRAGEAKIGMQGLPSGSYFAEIIQGGKVERVSIMKK